MQIVNSIINFIISLGGATFMPIIILFVGTVFGMKPLMAFRSGLLIGIGLTGITLVLGLLTGTLRPVVQALIVNVKPLDVIDVGWEMTSSTAWSTPYAAAVVPLGVLLNLIMLKLKWTKTLNVDIWNYWHFLFCSSIAYVITGSFVWGLVVALFGSMVTLWVADWLTPIWQEYFDLAGTSCTTMGNIANIGVESWFFGKLLDMTPLKDVNISPEGIQKRFGTLGEPMFVGVIVGALLAALARTGLKSIFVTGVAMAGVLQLMPRMVQLLMEGLRPIAIAAQDRFRQWLGEEEEVVIGMDIALGLGDPTSIAAVVLLVPVKLGLALILPGNRWLPLASLASPYLPPFPAAFARGDLLKTVIIGALATVVSMYLGTIFRYESTAAVQYGSGVMQPEGTYLGGAGGLHYAVTILVSRVVAPLLGDQSNVAQFWPK